MRSAPKSLGWILLLLLTEAKSTPTHHNLTFLEIGILSAGYDLGILATEVNVTAAVVEFNELIDAMDDTYQKVNTDPSVSNSLMSQTNHTFTNLHVLLNKARDELQVACDVANCPVDLKNPEQHRWQARIMDRKHSVESKFNFTERGRHRRKKRQLGFVTLGLTLYNSAQTVKLSNEVFSLEANQQHIVATVDAQTTAIKANSENVHLLHRLIQGLTHWKNTFESKQWLNVLTVNFRDYVLILNNWSSSLASTLISGTIAPRFYDSYAVAVALQELSERAKPRGLIPVVSNLPDVLRQDVSYVAKNGIIRLLIHIPLKRLNALTLFHYVPSPMVMDSGRVVIVKTGSFLAVNQAMTEFTVKTSEELNSCKRFRSVFLCDNAITNTDLDSHCLPVLFRGRSDLAHTVCQFEEINPDKPVLSQLTTSRVSIYSPRHSPATILISCIGRDSTSAQLGDGQHEVSVPDNCLLTTGDQTFRPSRVADIQVSFHVRSLTQFNESVLLINDQPKESLEMESLRQLPDIPLLSILPTAHQHNAVAFAAFSGFFALVAFGVTTLVRFIIARQALKTKEDLAERGRKKVQSIVEEAIELNSM